MESDNYEDCSNNGAASLLSALENDAYVEKDILRILKANNNLTMSAQSAGKAAMTLAIERCFNEAVLILVNRVDTSVNNKDVEKALTHALCYNSSIEVIGKLFDLYLPLINDKEIARINTYYRMAMKGDIDGLNNILSSKAVFSPDIILEETNRMTAIHFACLSGRVESIQTISKHSTNPVLVDKYGRTSLMFACLYGQVHVVQWLLENEKLSKLLNVIDEDGRTAFMYACMEGHFEIVRWLLASNQVDTEQVNAKDNYGGTALMIACYNGHAHVVQYLLASGKLLPQCLTWKDQYDRSALMIACYKGHLSVVQQFLSGTLNTEHMNAKDKYGATAFMIACENGHLEVIQWLLAHGGITCDHINVKDNWGRTALMIACDRGNVPLVQCLLDSGKLNSEHMNAKNQSGKTALIIACEKGYLSIVQALINCGKLDLRHLNAKSEDKRTALMIACEFGHMPVVKYLLENANLDAKHINQRDKYGRPALLVASYANQFPVVQYLLTSKMIDGEHVNAIDNNGKTALIIAYYAGKHEVVQWLLESGKINADHVNAKVEGGKSALTIACEKGHVQVVQLLLESGKLNSKNDNCKPALLRACHECNLSLVQCILSVGQDFHTKEIVTAFRFGMKQRSIDLMAILLTKFYNVDCIAMMLDASICSSSLCLSVLQKVYDSKESSVLRSIAYTKDKRGRTLFHLMHKDVVDYFKKRIYFRGRYEIYPSQPVHCSATSVVYQAIDHGMESEYEAIFFSYATSTTTTDISFDRATTPRYMNTTPNDIAFSIDSNAPFIQDTSRYAAGEDRRRTRTSSFDIKSIDSGESSSGLTLQYDTFHAAWIHSCTSFESHNHHEIGDEEEEESIFEDYAVDGYMSLDQWLTCCKRQFGTGTRAVAIKFMQEKDQYDREIQKRRVHPQDPNSESMLEPYVLGIVHHFHPDNISVNEQTLLQELQLPNEGCVVRDYPYGIIMPAADRNLDTIYRSERPDLTHIKVMMQEIGEALHHCHAHGIIHGDLKMLNIVRVQGKMRLIDLDAAAVIEDEIYGAKFSSGILPPEMFCRLENQGNDAVEAYHKYWSTLKDKKHENMYKKIEPKIVPRQGQRKHSGGTYVVKTFHSSRATTSELPYHTEMVLASPAIDIWSFGILLYALCTGQSFLPVNRDDDLMDANSMQQASQWTEKEITHRIHATSISGWEADTVRDLLRMLLRVDPTDRPSSMAEVLQHPFFVGTNHQDVWDVKYDLKDIKQSHKVLRAKQDLLVARQEDHLCTTISYLKHNLQYLGAETLRQLKCTEKVLLRGMLEATEVLVPSCFTIVNQKLHANSASSATSGASMAVMTGLTTTAITANTFPTVPSTAWTSQLAGFVDGMYSFYDSIGTMLSPETMLTRIIAQFVQQQTLYLYLIDEYTMEPVIPEEGSGSIYPITIHSVSDFVPSMAVLLEISWKAVLVAKGVTGLVRAMGLPTPEIPKHLYRSLRRMSRCVNTNSNRSVDYFDRVEEVVMKLHTPRNHHQSHSIHSPETFRGASLRALERFLHGKDPTGEFAGLRRVYWDDGKVCWTQEGNIDIMRQHAAREVDLVFQSFTLSNTTSDAFITTQQGYTDGPMVIATAGRYGNPTNGNLTNEYGDRWYHHPTTTTTTTAAATAGPEDGWYPPPNQYSMSYDQPPLQTSQYQSEHQAEHQSEHQSYVPPHLASSYYPPIPPPIGLSAAPSPVVPPLPPYTPSVLPSAPPIVHESQEEQSSFSSSAPPPVDQQEVIDSPQQQQQQQQLDYPCPHCHSSLPTSLVLQIVAEHEDKDMYTQYSSQTVGSSSQQQQQQQQQQWCTLWPWSTL